MEPLTLTTSHGTSFSVSRTILSSGNEYKTIFTFSGEIELRFERIHCKVVKSDTNDITLVSFSDLANDACYLKLSLGQKERDLLINYLS